MCDDNRLEVGFTAPLWRRPQIEDLNLPPPRPIGFVHFGEPERSQPPGWLLVKEHREEKARWEAAMEDALESGAPWFDEEPVGKPDDIPHDVPF
jgi:hypothetical protein